MVFHLHAPFWYLLYFPLELLMGTLLQKYKLWRKTTPTGTIDSSSEENVQGIVVVITGANSGLGKCTATEMAKRGAIVVMGCRDLKRGEIARQEIVQETGSKTVELYQLDLSDFSSVRHFATKVLCSHPVIDILINNAGILLRNNKPQMTKEGWNLTMKTNHLGHFLLTKLLVDSISCSSVARVVNVSSTACITSTLDVENLMMCKAINMTNLGWESYCNSKLGNALFTKSLAKRYPSIKVFSLCPGFVHTDIIENWKQGYYMKWLFWQSVMFVLGFNLKEGVEIILFCSLGKKVGQQDSGGFFRFGNRLRIVESMLNDEVADQLWNKSEMLLC